MSHRCVGLAVPLSSSLPGSSPPSCIAPYYSSPLLPSTFPPATVCGGQFSVFFANFTIHSAWPYHRCSLLYASYRLTIDLNVFTQYFPPRLTFSYCPKASCCTAYSFSCATSRKVAGSIPDGVLGNFH